MQRAAPATAPGNASEPKAIASPGAGWSSTWDLPVGVGLIAAGLAGAAFLLRRDARRNPTPEPV